MAVHLTPGGVGHLLMDQGVRLLLARTSDFGANWRRVHTLRWESYNGEVQFPDPRHGFVRNGDYLGKSTDAGCSWLETGLVPGRLQRVSFVDSVHGWANAGGLYYTADGAFSWQLRRDFGDTILGAIQFINACTGYLAAMIPLEPYSCPLRQTVLLKTTDGGATWTKVLAFRRDTESSDRRITGLSFVSPDTGYVAVDVSAANHTFQLYRTTNGQDFVRLKLPVHAEYGWPPMCFFPGGRTGYVGVNTEESSWLLKTVDGGGESLGFWQSFTTLPWRPKKTTLLTYSPDHAELHALAKGTGRLWGYRLATGVWQERKAIPTQFRDGSITNYEHGVTVARTRSRELWSYDPNADDWCRLPDIPGETIMKNGSCIASDGTDRIYVLKGGRTREFWAYDAPSDQWQRRPDLPGAPAVKTAAIACDGEYVYVWPGGKTREFRVFDIAADTWRRLPDIPGGCLKAGTCLAASPYGAVGAVALLKGGSSSECWTYELNGGWSLQPGLPGKKKVQLGAQFTADENGTYYAIRAARLPDIWQTDELNWSGITVQPPPGPTAMVRLLPVGSVQCTDGAGTILPDSDWSSLTVRDVTGRIIARVRNSRSTQALPPPPPMARGVYFVNVATPAGTRTNKLVVLR